MKKMIVLLAMIAFMAFACEKQQCSLIVVEKTYSVDQVTPGYPYTVVSKHLNNTIPQRQWSQWEADSTYQKTFTIVVSGESRTVTLKAKGKAYNAQDYYSYPK